MASIIQRLLKRLGYEPIRIRKYASGTGGGGDFISTRPMETDLLEAYTQRIWVYVAVYNTAQAIAGLPWKLWRKVGAKGEEEVTSGKAFDILQEPNRDMSFHDLIEGVSVYLDLTGDAYVEKYFNPQTGNLVALYLLHSDKMRSYKNKEGKLVGWQYLADSKYRTLQRNQVIWFHYFNPLNDFKGVGAAEPAWVSILTDEYSLRYSKRFFEKDAIFRGYLKSPEFLGEREREMLKADWENAYSGLPKSFKTPLLEGGITFEKTSLTPGEIALTDLRKLNREEILASFGIPPGIAGIFEQASYGQMKAQERLFWTVTVGPRARKIERTLNQQLIPFLPDSEGLRFEFDLSQLIALQREDRDKSLTIRSYVDRGIMTINEARAQIGFKTKVPWGDENPVLIKESLKEPQIKKQVKTAFRRHEQFVERHEERLAKSIAKIISRYEDIVIEKLEKLAKQEFREEILIWDELKEELARLSKTEYERLLKLRGEEFIRAYNLDISFDVKDPRVLEFLENQPLKFADDVATTYQNLLRYTLKQGWDLGETPQQLTERVKKTFSGTIRGEMRRARTIARTEIGKAANSADYFASLQSGIMTGKEWQTAGVGVRPSHLIAEGQGIIRIDMPFQNGLMYPGDPTGPPEEIINCRCTLGYYKEGEW